MITELLTAPYADAVLAYLQSTENVVLLIVNAQLEIVDYNGAFKRLIKQNHELIGQSIHEFLFLENHQPFVPTAAGTQNIIFASSHNVALPMRCHVYETGDNLLIICDHQMLTKDNVIEKMSILSNEMVNMVRELAAKNRELEEAQENIKVLSGIIPICMYCKEIRNDEGYWKQLEVYISEHADVVFSHGICPKCLAKYFPEG